MTKIQKNTISRNQKIQIKIRTNMPVCTYKFAQMLKYYF